MVEKVPSPTERYTQTCRVPPVYRAPAVLPQMQGKKIQWFMCLSDLVIILCRPSEPGNVGAVCRAMKNMGLTRLRLVAPMFCKGPVSGKPSRTDAVLRARAVHAEQVWDDAETFDTLAAAVADLSLVIGTTRRRGRHRKAITQTPEECAAFLQSHPGPAALVFGNERTGLEAEE
ncbi:MAG: RNA methyltransferase, partial [Treponema sp.]|nr:RNA methyltransferase [Treponema sp.]